MRCVALPIVALGIWAACDRARSSASAEDSFRSAAARTLGQTRPYVARLSGSTQHVTCHRSEPLAAPTDVRCRHAHDASTLAAMATLAAKVGVGPASGRDTDHLWTLAILDLAVANDEGRTLDRAIALLVEAAARDTTNAGVLNDLAVAHLARMALRNDVTDLFLALDYIERAVAVSGSSTAVLFNRALILELLHLDAEADEAWQAYLRTESTEAWRAEASERLSRLRGRSVRPSLREAIDARMRSGTPGAAPNATWLMSIQSDPQVAREEVLGSLLPSWAAAVVAGDSAAARRTIEAALDIGKVLGQRAGDSSVMHLAEEAARTAVDPTRARAVAAATTRYAEGAALFSRGESERASPILAAAATSLRDVGAPSLAGWADVLNGAVDVYRGNYRAADGRFARTAHSARQRGDSALYARATWGLALSAARRGGTREADAYYTAAAAAFGRIGETLNYVTMQAQLADALRLLGRDMPALTAHYQALAALHEHTDPRLRHSLLLALGGTLFDNRMRAASIAVRREAVNTATTTDRPKDLAEALTWLADVEARTGRAGARAHLDRARVALATITDSAMQHRLGAELNAAEAAYVTHSDPAAARAKLTEAEVYYERQRIPVDRAMVLLRRAVAERALGDTSAADADLSTAGEIIAEQAERMKTPSASRELADAQREVYQQRIARAISRHDTTAAFVLSEQARGATLTRTGEVAELSSAIPRSRAVIAYTTLPDQLLLWIWTSDGLHLVRTPVGTARLLEIAERFDNLIQLDDDSSAFVVGRSLYDVLLRPAESRIGDRRDVVILTDGPLERLPFAALRDSAGRYVVERFVLQYAPSLRSAARTGIGRDAERTRLPPLIVGNPTFDPSLFPELDVLRSAGSEAVGVRAIYSNATFIAGDSATKRILSRELTVASLVHFAGHARTVPGAPDLSHLVLARAPGGVAENALYGSDIERLDLRRVGLVVLSSCGTGQRRSRQAEGLHGIADAFLDAGAGAVISSLWEADDDATADLMLELHRRLASDSRPAEALRAAQLRAVAAKSRRGHPKYWAAFRVQVR